MFGLYQRGHRKMRWLTLVIGPVSSELNKMKFSISNLHCQIHFCNAHVLISVLHIKEGKLGGVT